LGRYWINLFEKVETVDVNGVKVIITSDSDLAIALKDIFRPIPLLQEGAGAFLILSFILAFIAFRINTIAEKKDLEKKKKIAQLIAAKKARDAANKTANEKEVTA